MPTSIPYDASLALGNLVPQKKLDILLQIAEQEAPMNAAQEALDATIETFRSLDMTLTEMANMHIDTSELGKSREEAQQAILDAAKLLVSERLKCLAPVTKLRSQLASVNESLESPVDYNRTQIRKMPLSADSMKMDAQYFSFDEEDQSAENSMAAIKSFVSGAVSFLGTKRSMEATAAVQQQVSQQREHHDVQGTLIITASCTHKDAVLLAPLILDVDKAIRIWNEAHPDQMIKTNSVASMQRIAEQQETKEAKALHLLSGATYGSSFVGMVHVLRAEDTSAKQRMVSAASSLQAQMETGGWFASMEGGFGVNAQFANDAKRLLSSQQITSHVSLVTAGSIPSIKADEVAIGVKEFADFDPAKMMGKLATLANATTAAQSSVQEGAQAARTGAQMVAIRGAEIESVMSGLGKIDDGKNRMLDVNSLMTAFEDYIQKCLCGNIGVPITYYIKPITAAQLAQMWVAKYFPGQYLSIAGDDSGPQGQSANSSSPEPAHAN